ncbi:TPA: hypothetical protein N0F65_004124 [Lagenidium giganteum]|uniref:Cytidyltransferase-like domain-containing protein n=1 Tax=Lagenidium giganteum TaxID=4803 RepID=A0AAV2ZDU3_9STRA|nr:TPA: hypothetical protein N0F65_004124 [Lagenidium giganteum]
MRKAKLLPNPSAPVVMGSNSWLAVLAGVVAVVGVSTLQKRRHAKQLAVAQALQHKKTQVQVALLGMSVPKNFRDLVKNDVLLEKAVENVATTLIIYVDGQDAHEIVNYTSELYTMVWDIACLYDKPMLDVRIVGGFSQGSVQLQSWDDLLLLPELNAVFGEDALVDVQQLNAKRFEKDGLFAVTYHPLSMYIDKRLLDEYHYFENANTSLTPFDLVVVGGTFDHLHNGHKKLLSLATSICTKRLLIGVTSDVMLRKKQNGHLIESIEQRKRKVHAFVSFLNPRLEVEVVTIDDAYGPTITLEERAALVVSTETLAGASKINSIRHERGLVPMEIYCCRRTESSTLSSSYIRERWARS